MIIYVCRKCKYTDLSEETENQLCPRCGESMVSLGLDSAEWNALGYAEKKSIIEDIADTQPGRETGAEPAEHTAGALRPEHTASAMSEERISGQAARLPGQSARLSGHSSERISGHSTERISGHSTERISGQAARIKKAVPEAGPADAYPGRKSQSREENYSYSTYLKRKNRHGGRVIIPIAVIAAIAAACVLIVLGSRYFGRTDTDAPVQETADTDSAEEITSGTGDDGEYDFSGCLYYDSISEEDREVYRIAYDLVAHKDEKGYSRSLRMDRFEYAERESSFFAVVQAMLSDHPELFYLQSNGRKFGIRTLTLGNICKVTFTLGEGEPDENEKIARFERATEEFLSGIDLNASDPEIEMQIHDKLIELVTYDHELLARDSEGDLGFTAYGALVEDSRGLKNRAVCGGYAQAFQHLLKRAGIEAAYVTGYADSESGTLSEQGSHAWNIVKLGGQWYEVDCCWDDIDAPGDGSDREFYELIRYEQPQYFNATHHWYNRTTEEMRFLPEENTVIRVQMGSSAFELRPCATSTHQRKKEKTDDGYEAFLYLNQYLPLAEGTEYAVYDGN